MSEPFPPTQVPQETLAYQPISGWAIAGLAISVLFTLLVIASVSVALFIGVPMFLHPSVIALPIASVLLSWIGLWHVMKSEGTRAGAKLARIGIWLSLVPGLCYFSYWYFTGLALQNQANSFLLDIGEDSGFFARLKQSGANPVQLNAAFLLTLPATQRGNIRPENEAELRKIHDKPTKEASVGLLSAFKESVYARIFFGDLGKDAEVTPLAVQAWKYEARRYQVCRIYRVKTREITIDFYMTVESTEGEAAGEGRKWFVNLNESGPAAQGMKQFTPLGAGVKILRSQARMKVERWFASLNDGDAFPAFAEVDQTAWERLRLPEGERARAKAAIARLFLGVARGRFGHVRVGGRDDEPGKWEQTSAGKIRMYYAARFTIGLKLTPDAGQGAPAANVDCQLVLESRRPIDPVTVAIDADPAEWDIVRIVVTQVSPAMDKPGM